MNIETHHQAGQGLPAELAEVEQMSFVESLWLEAYAAPDIDDPGPLSLAQTPEQNSAKMYSFTI